MPHIYASCQLPFFSDIAIVISEQQDSYKVCSLQENLEVGEMNTIRKQDSAGHVLTLKFTGQQVAGMRGLFSQQCWLNSFQLPMSIVEPFLMESQLVHSSKVWEEEEEEGKHQNQAKNLKLRNLFKIPSGGSTGLSLTSWDVFMRTSARKLIVVNVANVYGKKCLHYGPSCSKKTSEQEWKYYCKPLMAITNSVAYLEAQGFQVVRRVCLNCSISEIGDFSPSYLTEHLFGSYKPQEVTLLFSHWKFSFQITSDCKPCPKMLTDLQPQTRLNEDAAHYIDAESNRKENWDHHCHHGALGMVPDPS